MKLTNTFEPSKPLYTLTIGEFVELNRKIAENNQQPDVPIPQQPPDQFRYIPINDIFKQKICSKPTFYTHLRANHFTLYKFGSKSFVDKLEFEQAFHKVKLNGK